MSNSQLKAERAHLKRKTNCRNTKIDECRLADMHVHGIDMLNVHVSMKDRIVADMCQKERHEGMMGNSVSSVLSSKLRLMPRLKVANTPQTRLLHVVCDMVFSHFISCD